MLKRIFVSTLSVGVLCTFWLSTVSPSLRNFLNSWSAETDFTPIEGVRALYILVPLVPAILSRMFYLHDRVSDLLRLREHFDLTYFLHPFAEGVGLPTTGSEWERIADSRDLAMTRTLYRYASFSDPKIDVQLVRSAADQWAWFWCTVESLVILAATATIFGLLTAWLHLFVALIAMVLVLLLSRALWILLRARAADQVAEILRNPEWGASIRSELLAISGGESTNE